MTQIQKDDRHVCLWDDPRLDFSDLRVRVVCVFVRVKKQEKSQEVEDGLKRVRQQNMQTRRVEEKNCDV